jgi:hypothetical protein
MSETRQVHEAADYPCEAGDGDATKVGDEQATVVEAHTAVGAVKCVEGLFLPREAFGGGRREGRE